MEKRYYSVNEIFYSIQGEGAYTGRAAIFIRLAKCSLSCSFCDTEFSPKRELTAEEILNEAIDLIKENQLKVKPIVVWTGGEPLLQVDSQILSLFSNKGFSNHIETNGTIEIEESLLNKIDWLTVSPKIKEFPNSLKQISGDELKIVYQEQSIEELKELEKLDFAYFYIQPCSMQKFEEIINLIKQRPVWILSMQIQKVINIR